MYRHRGGGLPIQTEQLFEMDVRDVIDVTPGSYKLGERRLWRGGSVALLGLKLARGDSTLNPRKSESRGRGFNASYSYAGARGYAALGAHWRQFSAKERVELAELTGQDVPHNFIGPGIVFSFQQPPKTRPISDGIEFVGEQVPFGAMDEYSLEALEGLFGVEIPRNTQQNSLFTAVRASVGHLAAMTSFTS